jgi:hypothetical protein
MPSKLQAIDGRCKSVPSAVARPSDFSYHEVAAINSACVLEDATLSLYCIDSVEHTGLFVRTPPQIELGRAPFLYLAHGRAAPRVPRFPVGAGAWARPRRGHPGHIRHMILRRCNGVHRRLPWWVSPSWWVP